MRIISRPITTTTTRGKCKHQRHTNLLEAPPSIESEEGFISPNDPNDDSLTNVIKSCRRLTYTLSKLPPLPKYTSTPSIVPSFRNTSYKSTNTAKRICWDDIAEVPEKIPDGKPLEKCLIKHGKCKITNTCVCHSHKHGCKHTSDMNMSTNKTDKKSVHSCCCKRLMRRKCETEQLPWMQQHLVLNQTFNNCTKDAQHSVQCKNLTESAGMTSDVCKTTATTTTTTATSSQLLEDLAKRNKTCSTPSCYFKKLLTRNQNLNNMHSNCAYEPQHTKKPITVDITVSLVPKQKTESTEVERAENSNQEHEEEEEETILQIKNNDHIDFQDDVNLQSTQL